MGVKGEIGEEGANFVRQRYGEHINENLTKIATILYDCEVSNELTMELGGLVAMISGLNFIAGIEFCTERPEIAQKLKQRETQPYGASSSNGG